MKGLEGYLIGRMAHVNKHGEPILNIRMKQILEKTKQQINMLENTKSGKLWQ